MGYYETYCQLCGVSPAIARLRTPLEPHSAAYSYSGTGFIDTDNSLICPPPSGCTTVTRPGRFGDDVDAEGEEHIAGPGCVSTQGYSGWRISEEEMKGCRSLICVHMKDDEWEREEDDEEWEYEEGGRYFLSGVGDGSPDEGPLMDLQPVRHGLTETWPFNTLDAGDDGSLPLHPACFDIFKHISKARLGKIDVHGLWWWRNLEGDSMFDNEFPRHPAVRNGKDQWWNHEVGSEWLVANPVHIPSFPTLLQSCKQETQWAPTGTRPFDVYSGAFILKHRAPNSARPETYAYTTPPSRPNPSDHFMRLPTELLAMILPQLSSQDVANLRLVTPVVRQLPVIFFRGLLEREMPWLWEVGNGDLKVETTNWYQLWCKMRVSWRNLKGVRNRIRVWEDVNEVVRRIEMYREQGHITDEDGNEDDGMPDS